MPEVIDPAKHRFIGAFRDPQPPDPCGAYAMLCPCHDTLKFMQEIYDHWLRGHFDQQQYVDIKEQP